ncbi:DUF5939 domain-containing protein [Rhizobium sp. S152]|uniref:adenylate/guanylate cyclase domain-containing protein n=1 Tax=Rhizobium sp. S152 TaxID=3055038 RepID=UPI0025A990DE|nr:adenylate/guanylate cyclase domain-containing protein [Rhizobium sp. S152]MDM9627792.1 DUF5939 domain-containing protein [Rhizobium sp. S152]
MAGTFDFSVLLQSADPNVLAAFEQAIQLAPDIRLNRINPLRFAAEHELDPAKTIAGFLYATQQGIFELSWNVVCPTCGGVLHAAVSLTDINQGRYTCALCASDCEPSLDETVEVTFTVDPRVRTIQAHEPEALPLWQYMRQCFWSSGSDLPDDLEPFVSDAVLEVFEIGPGASVERSVRLESGAAVLFDPVTHRARFLQIDGSASAGSQRIEIKIEDTGPAEPLSASSGVVDLSVTNRTQHRVLPILWTVGPALKQIVSGRVPVLTASRLMSSQSFRDLFGSKVLDVNQRFKITRLSFLFIDLKESTQLYEDVGDLAAYDFVRAYFLLVQEIVTLQGGAVVKTIGDAVMATFLSPVQCVTAALAMKNGLRDLNAQRGGRPQAVRIGVHSGPCLAVLMNDRQDYFGQTVNIASRLQGVSSDRILMTRAVADDDDVRAYLKRCSLELEGFRERLRGIDAEFPLFAIRT